jgi:uncharacterized protein
MLDTIEKLLILQDRDQKISRQQGELARIEPERQMLKVKDTNAQAALESAKLRVRELESARKDLELEVETKKQAIVRYANQQFQTRKNEEYRALQHEIDGCKEAIFGIENQEIELMEQGEAAQKEVLQATQTGKEIRKLVDEQLALLAAREDNLKKDLATLQTDRETLAAAVDEVARSRYERLVRSKGESVVVGIQHGVCGGCHMRVPPQLLVTCQGEKELVSCSNCGRILYYTSDMSLVVAE